MMTTGTACTSSRQRWSLGLRITPTTCGHLRAIRSGMFPGIWTSASTRCGSGDVDLWGEVLKNKNLFLSKSCAEQFRGFALAQRQRYMGERGQGKHGQRPELETKFGFDTKAAMHVMRLLGEGIELMQAGKITYPRPNKDILIAVREGKYDIEFLKEMTDHLFHDLDVAQAESSLPDQVDREAISQFLTKFYLRIWGN